MTDKNTTIKYITGGGGENGGDGSDDDDNNDDDNEATEQPWLWYGRPLHASARQRRWRLVDGASASTTNSCTLVR